MSEFLSSKGFKTSNLMADVSASRLYTKPVIEENVCIVIVRTEWNAEIVDELESGCKRILSEAGVQKILTLIVPGAFEIPFAIKKFWEKKKESKNKPDAFIALGCVIRGGTPHFEYVCQAITDGVLRLNLLIPVPTIFGVLTVDNQMQAEERLGQVHGHKGEEAALAALKMISFMQNLKK